MDLTELLRPKEQGVQENPQYTKEEYAALKKAEREELWARVDAQAESVFADDTALRGFLDFTANCTPQRTANLLLLYQQNPEIRQPRTFEGWKKAGRSVRTGETGYTALIGQNYEREDGRAAAGYNIGKMFDISQTKGRPPIEPPRFEPEELVAAAIENSPVAIRISDQLPDRVQAQYVPKAHSVFVRNGMDAPSTFCAITREQAQAGFDTDRSYRRADYIAASYCVAYVTAKRYGLDVAEFDLSPAVNACAGLEVQNKRLFLFDVKSAAYTIRKALDRGLIPRESELTAEGFSVPESSPQRKTHRTKSAARE